MRRQSLGLASRLLTLEALTARGSAVSSTSSVFHSPFGSRSFAEAAPAEELKKTPLHDFHEKLGGKMVDFAGWSMPLQYEKSVMESSKHCRRAALLFDVSHMCGLSLKGKDAVPFLEKLVVGDIAKLGSGRSTLSVFTNEKGGIIDDTVITKVSDDDIYLVVNAGRRKEDLAHLGKHLSENSQMDVNMTIHDDRGLLALQGPAAAEVLSTHVDIDLKKLLFGYFTKADVDGAPCWITRTGYTGEDGFELSIPAGDLEKLATKFTGHEKVWLGGLGARDALRLEAGLCLYGNDISEETSPIEAGLTWTIAKSRREACNFLGGEVIKHQLKDGVGRRRVGLFSSGPPARQHSHINDDEGRQIGEVTSGAFSPNLGKNIAMGYVNKPLSKAGTKVKVTVRNKPFDAEVTKMPFVKANYFKG